MDEFFILNEVFFYLSAAFDGLELAKNEFVDHDSDEIEVFEVEDLLGLEEFDGGVDGFEVVHGVEDDGVDFLEFVGVGDFRFHAEEDGFEVGFFGLDLFEDIGAFDVEVHFFKWESGRGGGGEGM